MEPNEEQTKRFWDKLGVRKYPNPEWAKMSSVKSVQQQQEVFDRRLPKIDLHNLFKYAVPKIKGFVKLSKSDNHIDYIATVEDYELNQEGKIANPDPAIALFWAIWEVLNGK